MTSTQKTAVCVTCQKEYSYYPSVHKGIYCSRLCYDERTRVWSKKHQACTQCEKTDSEHNGKGICRKCWAKNRYQERKEEIIARTSAKQKENRCLVLFYYSNGTMACACCGENTYEFLVIDHINGGGNKQRQDLKAYGKHFVRWLIKNDFPEGFQILCHNCNMAKGFHGVCPHQRKDASQTTQIAIRNSN